MKIKLKKTPILLISILSLSILICGAFYYLLIENNGGMALAGTLYFLAFIVNAFVVFIEQTIIKKEFNMKKIWIIEIVLISVAVLLGILI